MLHGRQMEQETERSVKRQMRLAWYRLDGRGRRDGGWLRALRQMLEIPVNEFAQGWSDRRRFSGWRRRGGVAASNWARCGGRRSLDCELILRADAAAGTLGEMAASRSGAGGGAQTG